MAFRTTTNGLSALEINLLICYSLTCNGFGALSCPLEMALKMDALQNPYFNAWCVCVCVRVGGMGVFTSASQIGLPWM